MKYKAQVNNHFQFAISEVSLEKLDVIKEGDDLFFHLLKDGKSFKAEVLSADYNEKLFKLKINGRPYELKLEDQFDQLVSKLGLEISSGSKLKDIKAPMPGLVLGINVSPGQTIEKGDKLLILEAMKMENVIKADGEGTVKAIHVEQGNAVDKGQLLIEME